MPTDLIPVPSTPVVLDADHAADLADLLRCLRELIDAEHDQLAPLLAKHHYDVNGLRIAVDLYAGLLHTTDDQPPF